MSPAITQISRCFRWAGLPVLLTLFSGPTAESLLGQSGTPPADQQRPEATFRVQVDSVEVHAIVTDEDGRFVRDLRAQDFQILEDGKPQKISAFDLVDLPVRVRSASATAASPFASRPLEPDVSSNEHAAETRVYVLVLDDIHTHAVRSPEVKKIAREFFERYFAPGDMAAVVYTSGRSDAAQEFTTSRHLLLEAVDKFAGRKMRSAILERQDELRRQREAPGETIRGTDPRSRSLDPLEAQRADAARRMLGTLRAIGQRLDAVRGRRKAVVLVSEGVDYDMEGGVTMTESGLTTSTSPSASDVLNQMREAINASVRSNAVIYSIDPRGLSDTGRSVIEMSAPPDNPHLGLGPEVFQEEMRRAQDTLRVLAAETGGVAAVTSNDFDGILERIVTDNSTYYILAYTSSNNRRDGRFRPIEVRVNRPGVRVQARRGYTAPSARPTRSPELLSAAAEPLPVLRDALNSPLPLPGITLRSFAVPYKGAPDASVLVGIEVEGAEFDFKEKDGHHVGTVSVAFAALDSKGILRAGDRRAVEMQLKPETYGAVRARGVRVFFRASLPPGRYQIRVGAHESGGGLAGSVHSDLQVPEFSQLPLSTSGVVLTSTRAALTPTAAPDQQLATVLAAPPTASRDFTACETIGAYLEVYSASGSAAPADLSAVLVGRDGRALMRSVEELSGQELREPYRWFVPIPLRGIEPGPYVLRLELKSRTLKLDGTVHEVPLHVRAAEGPCS